MKKITLLSLSIALVIGGCARNKPVETTILGIGTDYTLIPNTLKGKIKEMKELNYWATEKDGIITKGNLMSKKDLDSVVSTPNFKAFFDDKGTLTRYDLLDGENVIESHIGTVENGKWKRWDYKLKDSAYYYFLPQYDSLGYFTGGTGYRPISDTLVNKFVVTHDGKGNFTKFEYFNHKNQKTGYHICKLDEKGNYIESKFFNKADSLVYTMTNIYDNKGSLTKQQVINEKPVSTVNWVYEDLKSDDHGNTVEYYSNVDNGKYKIFVERSYIYY